MYKVKSTVTMSETFLIMILYHLQKIKQIMLIFYNFTDIEYSNSILIHLFNNNFFL
jgi:hypothetical protein